MKLSSRHLSTYVTLPSSHKALRNLLDDVGIEVKRQEPRDADMVFTVELLANRGDHYCYEGVARELSGRTGDPVSLPETLPLETGPPPIPVHVESALCLKYTATLMVRNEAEGTLPTDVIQPLIAAGLQSVTPPVDATNLCNLELGQPTHAFDADTIVGGIHIRLSTEGEQAWALFTEAPIPLPVGTLVIADEEKILAIAGVIGCEESKATEHTTRLLIESGTFDPVSVRKASRALSIHTDSSARFERGADPTRALSGAQRVAWLLSKYAGWEVSGTTGVSGDWEDPGRHILLSIPAAASFLEYPLTAEEAETRLTRYGFAVSKPYPAWTQDARWEPHSDIRDSSRDRLKNTVLVRVPPHRLWDVEFANDLYEELAKSIGYNDTPERLPPIDTGAMPSPKQVARSRIEEVLLGYGFFEIFTDGFYGRDSLQKLQLPDEHPLQQHVETQNALERGYSLLKNNNVIQALDAVVTNLNRRNSDIKAYEFNRTFHLSPSAENGVCSERETLWMVASGTDRRPDWAQSERAIDPWYLKSIIASIGLELGAELTLVPPDPEDPHFALLHPNRQASIQLNGEPIGVMGELHPKLLGNWKIKRAKPCFIQMDSLPLCTEIQRPKYVEPGTVHPIDRSLAFTLPGHTNAGDIASYMLSAGPEWLRKVDMLDRYVHDHEGSQVATITFALQFTSETGNRTAEEVNAACAFLIRAVEERFSDQHVTLRA